MDEATWLASDHFQKLYGHLKRGRGLSRSPTGRRRFRLLACAICRSLLWHLPVRDCDRAAVRAAEAFADGLIDRDALDAAQQECHLGIDDVWYQRGQRGRACQAMIGTTGEKAASAAYLVAMGALGALGLDDRPQSKERLCSLVREVFGNLFRPLAPSPGTSSSWRASATKRSPRTATSSSSWPTRWPTWARTEQRTIAGRAGTSRVATSSTGCWAGSDALGAREQ